MSKADRKLDLLKKLILVLVISFFATSFTLAQNMPPTIFYSNLTSGPNTGGQSNAGAFVTIYGKGFGAAQGSSVVTIGGGKAASYQSWSDTAVTFQLGSAAKSGSISAIVGGVTSNSVPYTVRAGNIYFVASNGSNNRKYGTYAKPWQTLVFAKNTIQPGDIVYVENGYVASSVEANNSAVNLSRAGTATAPMAIVAYPKSTATVGSTTAVTNGFNITAGNWVISGLTIRGAQAAVSVSNLSGIRLVGSDVSCPNGYGTGGCITTSGGSSLALLGNNIHDNGSTSNTNLASYSAVNLVGTNSVVVGWNKVANTRGCNAVDAHSNSGPQNSFSIHDNYISNTRCTAISLGTVDPSQGAVNVYNNVVVNSGTGPMPGGTSSQTLSYSGIAIAGSATASQVYNNTFYNAGAFGGTSAAAVRAPGAVNLTNNIFYLVGNEWYVSPDSNLSYVNGTNNIFFGNGSAPGMFSNSVSSDPMFVNIANSDFHLLPGSAAIDAGTTVNLSTDYDGALRPQGNGYDIGAYESANQASVAGTLSASPASLSIGNVTVGQSTTTTTTLTNTGNASVTISQINSNNSNFQPSGLSFPLTLGAGQSATLTVIFAPTSAGDLSGTLAVISNASNATNISVAGTGIGVTPTVSMSPTSLTFGSQVVSTTSAAQSVTVSNTSSAVLSISSITASGDFTQTNNCGASLAANSSCSVLVTFAPTVGGTRTGAISFIDNAASSPQQVSLTGVATGAATPNVSLSPSSLTFGSQIVGGTSAAQSVTLTNTGTGPLSISSVGISGDFAETNNCGSSLAAQASCQIAVTFAPTTTGSRTGGISVVDNATSSPQQLTLSGTAIPAPVATLSAGASSVSFGSITVGSTGTQSVVITNSGNATANIQSISTGNAAFSVSGAPATLAAGSSVTLSIGFAPAVAGTYTGTLTIQSNASNSILSVGLNGTGKAVAVSHSVALSWNAVSSVSGYNVYRSMQSGSGYAKLNGSLNAAQAYSDTAVSGGGTYYYVVTAVDSTGVESAYSSEVTAVIPAT